MRLFFVILISVPLHAQLTLWPLNGSSTSFFPNFAPGTRVRVTGTEAVSSERCLVNSGLKMAIYPVGQSRPFPVRLLQDYPESCGRLEAVLPSDLPLGPAEAIVSAESGNRVSGYLRVVPFQMEIMTEGILLPGHRLMHPLSPESTVVLQTTGAGNTPTGELTVHLGNLVIPVQSLRRSAQELGIDELEFVIPRDSTVADCYAPLTVHAGSSVSNSALAAVMPSDSPCVHPFDLTRDQMELLDNGGAIVLGELHLDRFGQELASLRFEWATSSVVAVSAGLSRSDTAYRGCRINSNEGSYTAPGGFFSLVRRYDPGVDFFVLTTPSQQNLALQPEPSTPFSSYVAVLNSEPGLPLLSGGDWTLRGPASRAMEAIEWRFTLPPRWRPELAIAEGRTIEVRWSGDLYSEGDVVSFSFSDRAYQVWCTSAATDGALSFTLPEGVSIPADLHSAVTGGVSHYFTKPILRPLNLLGGNQGVGLIIYSLWN